MLEPNTMPAAQVLPFPRPRADVRRSMPFTVATNLPAGAGVDFASHFCTLFQRELADRFFPAKEKQHGL